MPCGVEINLSLERSDARFASRGAEHWSRVHAGDRDIAVSRMEDGDRVATSVSIKLLAIGGERVNGVDRVLSTTVLFRRAVGETIRSRAVAVRGRGRRGPGNSTPNVSRS